MKSVLCFGSPTYCKSRFQLANANDEDNYLCLTNLHDLSDRPLDRNTHVVSIHKSPQWADRTEERNLILGVLTAGAYLLSHPRSALVYRFSFTIGLFVDNKNFLQNGSLRRAADNMRDFIHGAYFLRYNDPLPGQRIRISIYRSVYDSHLSDLPSLTSR